MFGLVLALLVLIALSPWVVDYVRARRLADERRRRGLAIVEPQPAAPVVAAPVTHADVPAANIVSELEWQEVNRAASGPKAPPRSGTGGGAARKMRRKAELAKRKAAEREARAIFRSAAA